MFILKIIYTFIEGAHILALLLSFMIEVCFLILHPQMVKTDD